MAKKTAAKPTAASPRLKSSALVDTRVIYCGDNLDQLKKLPDACIDLIYIDPPFNSNRNYEIFWPETSEKRRFDDRHESTTAYIEYPIQVKQKDKVGRPDIDGFETAMRRAARTKGFFVSFDYSEEAEREVTRFWKEEQRTIILLTVKELLDGNFAHKLV
jgi:hypothetical protein